MARFQTQNRHGLILERLYGSTLLSEIFRRPNDLLSLAELLAETHISIHECKTENLPSQRQEVKRILRQSLNVTEADRDKGLRLLSELPDSSSVCHGDFHPGNVIVCQHGTYTVDWLDAMYGCPLGDVAQTILKIRHAIPSGLSPDMLAMANAARGPLESAYRDCYVQKTGSDHAVIDGWIAVLSLFQADQT